MTDKDPKELSAEELREYVEKRFGELKEALQEVERRDIQDALKKFKSLAISLAALTFSVASLTSEEYVKFRAELERKGKEARLKLAEELESLAKKLKE
ncbi:MAG: hypothetical protein QMD78_07235 [Methanocellales archaeon]|nr:hypothetical protein [Methanocellales archaeon]